MPLKNGVVQGCVLVKEVFVFEPCALRSFYSKKKHFSPISTVLGYELS